MRVAYIINQYPKVSHSFIRREILALERQGLHVERVAIRGWKDTVVDKDDVSEKQKTQYVLAAGAFGLFKAALFMLMTNPVRFFSVFSTMLGLAKKADRAYVYHVIYFFEACYAARLIASKQVQHLHAHFGTNSTEVAMLTSLLTGVPYSFTVHGPEEFDKPQALHLTEKIAAAKFVVAISSFGRSQLFRWCDYAQWDKIKVVHCGLEPTFFESGNDMVEQGEPRRLVCVGRLCEQKGQLLLVQAVANLKKRGVAFQLVLAGDGEMRAEIERMIQQHQLETSVTITGWISSEQVRNELLAAKAMVLASFAEGLPVVIMEAMVFKRPVITTYVAGIPELVKHEKNGWLIPAGDIQALEMAIETALNVSQEDWERMGTLARQDVIARHHIDHEAMKLASFFKA